MFYWLQKVYSIILLKDKTQIEYPTKSVLIRKIWKAEGEFLVIKFGVGRELGASLVRG